MRNSKHATITAIEDGETKCIISRGNLEGFQATYAMIREHDEGMSVDAKAAANIGLSVGDEIRYIPR